VTASVGPSPALASPAPELALETAPLIQNRYRWLGWAAPLISLAVLGAALWQWFQLDLSSLVSLVPVTPAFWLVYLVYYFLGPASEWLIFRRLWRLPASGIMPLLRKKVSNELIVGYLGEVYFYLWARRNSQISAAPFGAIKDVAVLSAVCGNGITLLMLLLGAPLVGGAVIGSQLQLDQTALLLSIIAMGVTSTALVLLRRHVLSLPGRELFYVTVMHCARIILGVVLLALMWHLALPHVALTWWILLSMLRQLVTRLPFVANKDVVFAGMAIFLVGEDESIAGLMALVAGIVLATHVVVGIVVALSEWLPGAKGQDGPGGERTGERAGELAGEFRADADR